VRPSTEKISAPERHAELFDLIGSTIGSKYKLDRLLGVGGMGGVYAATPIAGGNQVAIKVLSVADPTSRERIAKRFAREAHAVLSLRSPHIVTIIEAGSDDARPYLVMELLEGEDLGQRIRHAGRIPLKDALHVAAQVLVALGTAHDGGIVHRDLKPDNVFLTKNERDPMFCKLLDFGMSKTMPGGGQTVALELTKKGMAVGTPFYMAPEQARAMADVDGRVDLWALGAILFECLTGRPPFVGASQEQVLIAICTTVAPDVRALRPDVPSPVAKLISRALTRDRAKRFGSAWQMLASLVEVAPEERPLLPAPVTAASDRSGPQEWGVTMALGPIPAASAADASGPYIPPISHNPSEPARVSAAHARREARARMVRVTVIAVCALILGIGVAVYVLAMLAPHGHS
jgi:serine/threonine protein kinase